MQEPAVVCPAEQALKDLDDGAALRSQRTDSAGTRGYSPCIRQVRVLGDSLGHGVPNGYPNGYPNVIWRKN